MSLQVYFRSCEGVDTFTGPRRIVGPKRDVILTSLQSLARSIYYASKKEKIKLTIIDDHSSDKTRLDMARIVDHYNIWYTLVQLEETGNGASLRCNFNHALEATDELILFTEDDYLYSFNAIEEMLDAHRALSLAMNRGVILHPSDYPDRYFECEPSYILTTKDRHWRSTSKTTCTFMIDHSLIKDNWSVFETLGQYGENPNVSEETTINKLLVNPIRGFSPIPTLAVHLQYESTIPPFVLWESWWKSEKHEVDRILK